VRLIGLDPGLRRTGWGIIDVVGNRLTRVAEGVVRSDENQPMALRLVALHQGVLEVIDRYQPSEAAIEETFVNKNAVTTLKLGLARGVVLLAPAERGLVVAEYASTAVKKAIVGTGHAEKAQVQMMVGRLLPGAVTSQADAADALAVAICHAHHAGTGRNWQAATVMAGGAELSGAKLSGPKLSGAKLSGAKLSMAKAKVSA
jgi:crossover junction endodeoxyribonuclease RuvC